MTEVLSGELQDISMRLSQLSLDSDTFTNEDVINVIKHMDTHDNTRECMRLYYVYEKSNDPNWKSIEEGGTRCLRTEWSDYTPAELVDNIVCKNVKAGTFTTPGSSYNSPVLIATNLIIPIILSQHRLFEGWKGLTANEVLWQFSSSEFRPFSLYIQAPDADSHVGLDFSGIFLPYITYGSFDYWIHPQTDDERADEAFKVLLAVFIAAAAAVVAKTALKVVKKMKIKRATLLGKIRSAENALAADPTNRDAINSYLKSKKKLKRLDLITGIFSKGVSKTPRSESVDDTEIILRAIGVE
jgi:hypothetical protein